MKTATATVRELRLDFRLIKRKVEQHGEVVITDNGKPSFVLKALPLSRQKEPTQPDYYARLLKIQPKPLGARAAKALHDENRGDR